MPTTNPSSIPTRVPSVPLTAGPTEMPTNNLPHTDFRNPLLVEFDTSYGPFELLSDEVVHFFKIPGLCGSRSYLYAAVFVEAVEGDVGIYAWTAINDYTASSDAVGSDRLMIPVACCERGDSLDFYILTGLLSGTNIYRIRAVATNSSYAPASPFDQFEAVTTLTMESIWSDKLRFAEYKFYNFSYSGPSKIVLHGMNDTLTFWHLYLSADGFPVREYDSSDVMLMDNTINYFPAGKNSVVSVLDIDDGYDTDSEVSFSIHSMRLGGYVPYEVELVPLVGVLSVNHDYGPFARYNSGTDYYKVLSTCDTSDELYAHVFLYVEHGSADLTVSGNDAAGEASTTSASLGSDYVVVPLDFCTDGSDLLFEVTVGEQSSYFIEVVSSSSNAIMTSPFVTSFSTVQLATDNPTTFTIKDNYAFVYWLFDGPASMTIAVVSGGCPLMLCMGISDWYDFYNCYPENLHLLNVDQSLLAGEPTLILKIGELEGYGCGSACTAYFTIFPLGGRCDSSFTFDLAMVTDVDEATFSPIEEPTESPTSPSTIPTRRPTRFPTTNPAARSTTIPTVERTKVPTTLPTPVPSKSAGPASTPTVAPTACPSGHPPTNAPSVELTTKPVSLPSANPIISIPTTVMPSPADTDAPIMDLTAGPVVVPFQQPTYSTSPTSELTLAPTTTSLIVTATPTVRATANPTAIQTSESSTKSTVAGSPVLVKSSTFYGPFTFTATSERHYFRMSGICSERYPATINLFVDISVGDVRVGSNAVSLTDIVTGSFMVTATKSQVCVQKTSSFDFNVSSVLHRAGATYQLYVALTNATIQRSPFDEFQSVSALRGYETASVSAAVNLSYAGYDFFALSYSVPLKVYAGAMVGITAESSITVLLSSSKNLPRQYDDSLLVVNTYSYSLAALSAAKATILEVDDSIAGYVCGSLLLADCTIYISIHHTSVSTTWLSFGIEVVPNHIVITPSVFYGPYTRYAAGTDYYSLHQFCELGSNFYYAHIYVELVYGSVSISSSQPAVGGTTAAGNFLGNNYVIVDRTFCNSTSLSVVLAITVGDASLYDVYVAVSGSATAMISPFQQYETIHRLQTDVPTVVQVKSSYAYFSWIYNQPVNVLTTVTSSEACDISMCIDVNRVAQFYDCTYLVYLSLSQQVSKTLQILQLYESTRAQLCISNSMCNITMTMFPLGGCNSLMTFRIVMSNASGTSMTPFLSPTSRPTRPSVLPSVFPTRVPSVWPTSATPTVSRSSQPSNSPSTEPTTEPTFGPTYFPSLNPTPQPTSQPVTAPTDSPTTTPTDVLTRTPSVALTFPPTLCPSCVPTVSPTTSPTVSPSEAPTIHPTSEATLSPTNLPTISPTSFPTCFPTNAPTPAPTSGPVLALTTTPTVAPSALPTIVPTRGPTMQPTPAPTPAIVPTTSPTLFPTSAPTNGPTVAPTSSSTLAPTMNPTLFPSYAPTNVLTAAPTSTPIPAPTTNPTFAPSGLPTTLSTAAPTVPLVSSLTASPTALPTVLPTLLPAPSVSPVQFLTAGPTNTPVFTPTVVPSFSPTKTSSTAGPTNVFTSAPTRPTKPTIKPSVGPSREPTRSSTDSPTSLPIAGSSLPVLPSAAPTMKPSKSPTMRPTSAPTLNPTQADMSAWFSYIQQTVNFTIAEDALSDTEGTDLFFYVATRSQATATADVFKGSLTSASTANNQLCGKWAQFLNALSTATISNDVSSLKLLRIPNYPQQYTKEIWKNHTASCDSADGVAAILSALTDSAVAKISTEISCTNREGNLNSYWRMNACGSSISSINVNNSGFAEDFTLPACQGSCSYPSLVDGFSLLRVKLAPKIVPASIVSIVANATATTIQCHVSLSAVQNTYVVCSKATQAPGSPTEILLSGTGLWTSSSSADVTLSSLSPSATYTIYCLTMTQTGAYSSLTTSISQAVTISTQCCKSVTGKIVVPSVYLGAAVTSALQISLSSQPSSAVTITVVVKKNNAIVPSVIFPLNITLYSYSPSLAASFAWISPTVAGSYEISAIISGPSSLEYYSVYFAQSVINVFAPASEPTLPSISRVQFSSSGVYVTASFTAAVGSVSTLLTTGWSSCIDILSFRFANESTCQLSSDALSITILPSYRSALVVGDVISVLGGSLRAACSSADACTSWKSVAAASSTLSGPDAPVKPEVVMSAPSILGSCGDYVVDLTQSTGSGGRDWSNVSFKVVSADSNASVIEDYLNNNKAVFPPTSIPRALFSSAAAYTFITTLCNFLGACGEGTQQMVVIDSVVPVVSFSDANKRSVYRNTSFQLSAAGTVQSCYQTSAMQSSFSWTVADSATGVVVASTTTSKNAAKLLLPAYTLFPRSTYIITVTYTVLTSLGSNSVFSSTASTFVSVLQSPLTAIIAGGDAIVARRNMVLLLDGSGSYDGDQTNNGADDLSYYWGCHTILPLFSVSCGFLVDSSTVTTNSLRIWSTSFVPSSDISNSKFSSVFVLSVTGTHNRTAETSVTVSMVDTVAPVIAIETPLSRFISVAQRFALFARISFHVGEPALCTWSTDAAMVDLSTMSITPATVRYNASMLASPTTLQANLAFAANTLFSHGQLTFTLGCVLERDSSITSQAFVTLVTVSAPSPGSLTISPLSGVELETMFTIMAAHWNDDLLPLQYTFGFVDPVSKQHLTLLPMSYAPYFSTQLGAGIEMEGYVVQYYVAVFNSHLANTTEVNTAVVAPTEASEDTLITSLVTAISDHEDDVVKLTQTLSLFGAVYNRADCAMAPNCSSLSRHTCSRVPNTCGECFDTFVGIEGDSNDPCISLIAVAGLQAMQATIPKPCDDTETCSGRGNCYYANATTGVAVKECYLGSLTCTASCHCTDGYTGNSCELAASTLETSLDARQRMLEGFLMLQNMQDVDVYTVSAWTVTLSAIAQNAFQISSNATALIDAVNSIVSESLVGSVTPSATALDNLMMVLNQISTSASGISSTDGSNITTGVFASVALISQVLSDGLVAGQAPSMALYSNFRVTASALSFETEVSLDVPHTTAEAVSNMLTASVLLPAAVQGNASGTYTSVNVIYLKESSFLSTISYINATSSPLHMQLSLAQLCARGEGLGNYTVTVSLPHNVEVLFETGDDVGSKLAQQAEANSVLVECKRGLPGNFSVFCVSSGESVMYSCDGIWDYNVTVVCPSSVDFTAPSCAMSVNDDFGYLAADACSVISYDAWQTVCACNLCAESFSRQRRLSDEGTDIASVVATSVLLSAMDYASVITNPSSLLSADGVLYVIRVVVVFAALWIGLPVLWISSKAIRTMKFSKVIKSTNHKRRRSVSNFIDAPTRINAAAVLVDYATSILPEMYSNKSVSQRCWQELAEKVPFLIVLFGNTKRFKSYHFPVILFKLLTTLTYSLFALSFFFTLQYPRDDGTCSRFTEEYDCMTAKSAFDKSLSKCQWFNHSVTTASAESSGGGAGTDSGQIWDAGCSLAKTEYSAYMNILMCILVVVATTPILFILERLCNEILLAPTATELDGPVGSEPVSVVAKAVRGAVATASNTVRRASVGAVHAAATVRNAVQAASSAVGGRTAKQSRAHTYRLMEQNIVLPAEVLLQRHTAVQVCSEIPAFKKLALNIKHSHQLLDAEKPAGNRHDINNDDNYHNDQPAVSEVTRTTFAVRHRRAGAKKRTNGHRLLEDFWAQFMHDLAACRRQLHRANDLERFDESWGIESVSLDGALIILKQHSREAIQRERMHAFAVGTSSLAVLKNMPRSMCGAELMKLLFMDMMGSSTTQAKILKATVNEAVLQKRRVVTWGMKCCVIGGLFCVNLFFIYSCLAYAANRDMTWQYAWIVNAMINIAVELVLGPCLETFVLDCLIPGTIANDVEVAKQEVIRQVNRLCSTDRAQTGVQSKLEHVRSLSDRPFADLQSKYFYASRVVAEQRPDLMESALIHGHETRFPFVTDHTKQRIATGTTNAGASGSVMDQNSAPLTTRSWVFSSVGITTMVTPCLRYVGTFPGPVQRFFMQLTQPIYIAVFGFGFSYLKKKLGTVSTLLVIVIVLLTIVFGLGYILHQLLKGGNGRRGNLPTQNSSITPSDSHSLAKGGSVENEDDPYMFQCNLERQQELIKIKEQQFLQEHQLLLAQALLAQSSPGSKSNHSDSRKRAPHHSHSNRNRTRTRSSSYEHEDDDEANDDTDHHSRTRDNHSKQRNRKRLDSSGDAVGNTYESTQKHLKLTARVVSASARDDGSVALSVSTSANEPNLLVRTIRPLAKHYSRRVSVDIDSLAARHLLTEKEIPLDDVEVDVGTDAACKETRRLKNQKNIRQDACREATAPCGRGSDEGDQLNYRESEDRPLHKRILPQNKREKSDRSGRQDRILEGDGSCSGASDAEEVKDQELHNKSGAHAASIQSTQDVAITSDLDNQSDFSKDAGRDTELESELDSERDVGPGTVTVTPHSSMASESLGWSDENDISDSDSDEDGFYDYERGNIIQREEEENEGIDENDDGASGTLSSSEDDIDSVPQRRRWW
jgi:hypothetical protein